MSVDGQYSLIAFHESITIYIGLKSIQQYVVRCQGDFNFC